MYLKNIIRLILFICSNKNLANCGEIYKQQSSTDIDIKDNSTEPQDIAVTTQKYKALGDCGKDSLELKGYDRSTQFYGRISEELKHCPDFEVG